MKPAEPLAPSSPPHPRFRRRSAFPLAWLAVLAAWFSMVLQVGCPGGGKGGSTPTVAPPAGLSYAQQAWVYPQGFPGEPNQPSSSGGPVDAYTIKPDLPAGLRLDAKTGVIAGTPSAPLAPATEFTVTAKNAAGITTAKVTLTVLPGFTYVQPRFFATVGFDIPANAPVPGPGMIPPYAIDPPLPASLHFDPATGAITGKPIAAQGQVRHLITAHNAAGDAMAAAVILGVHATRKDGLSAPLAPVPNASTKTYRFLDFPGLRRTQQYSALNYPKAPIFHAYNPLDPDELRDGKLLIQTNLNILLPATFYPGLPDSLKNHLAALHLDPGLVDIFIESQDLVWKPGIAILFRPHYWTNPDEPELTPVRLNHVHNGPHFQVGIFEAEAGIHFQGRAPGDFFEVPGGISVHDDFDPVHKPSPPWLVISSPNNLQTAGLNPLNASTSFWTLTRLGNRAAATLHLILTDADQEKLEAITLQVNTLGELFQALEKSPLPPRMLNQLKALVQP